MQRNKATAIGVAAIFCWAAVMGTTRLSSESWGVLLGPAIIYSIAAIILWIVRTPVDLWHFPKKYLVVGGFLMAYTEIVLSIVLGLATDSVQTIEVSIVNYLWPALTVLVNALAANRGRIRWTLVPGVVIAVMGVVCALGGDTGLSPQAWISGVSSNPAPYLMALSVAVAWACYSVFTPALSHGHDGVTVFFSLVAIGLWVIFLANGAPVPHVAPNSLGIAAPLGAAAALASGYACWNVGILNGDLKLMAAVSYLAPILSSLASSIILGTTLSPLFWVGASAVTLGSILSWLATR